MRASELKWLNYTINSRSSSAWVLLFRERFEQLSPKIDIYVDLLICATSWASNHKFMLLSKIFKKLIIYDNISPCPFKRTLGLRGYVFFQEHIIQLE